MDSHPKSLKKKSIISALKAVLAIALLWSVLYLLGQINFLKQNIEVNRVKLERLRTRVYILEGEMNRGKWDAREAFRREVFEGAVRQVKIGKKQGE